MEEGAYYRALLSAPRSNADMAPTGRVGSGMPKHSRFVSTGTVLRAKSSTKCSRCSIGFTSAPAEPISGWPPLFRDNCSQLRVPGSRLPDRGSAPRDSGSLRKFVSSTARFCGEFGCRRTSGGYTCGSGRRYDARASLRKFPGPARDALAYRGDAYKRGRRSVAGVGCSAFAGWRSRALLNRQ